MIPISDVTPERVSGYGRIAFHTASTKSTTIAIVVGGRIRKPTPLQETQMKKRYERYYTTRQPGPKWSGAVTSENWKKTVLAAIRMLPLDIRLEVRHAITSDDSMIVTVARDSQSDDDSDDDGDDGEIEIRYWNTFRELGWPPESDGSYGPGGFDEKVADWPIISFNSTAQDPSRSLYANQASASDLIVEVQEAILEQMYDLGHVFKDAKGRFIRMIEPRKILGWQWTR